MKKKFNDVRGNISLGKCSNLITQNLFNPITKNEFPVKSNFTFWNEVMLSEEEITGNCIFDTLFDVILGGGRMQ